jgi:glycosyltransferase involved in cell wall biosynthesis
MRYYQRLIKEYKIEKRVIFPNAFYYGEELLKQVEDCQVGVVLYEVGPHTVTYYASPAKVKQYIEFGLPVIMTDAAEVASYIKRFNAGIIVSRDPKDVIKAIYTITDNYSKYIKGIQKFSEYFSYRQYYAKSFRFLENK